MSAFAPIDAAALSWPSSSFLDGMRIRLLVVATLITYGAWMYTSTSAAAYASRTAPGSPPGITGPFQPCGSPRKNWAIRASQAIASASGSSVWKCPPMRTMARV